MRKTADAACFELCVICYPYYPSRDTGRGHDRYVFELVQHIETVCSDARLSLLHQGFSKGVLIAGIKLFRFIAELLFTKADLYHTISPVGGATATILGKTPLVVTIHDLIPFNISGYDYSWKYCFMRFCIRTSVARSAAVVVPYKVTKDELVARFNVPEAKIHVVHYGVDHSHFFRRQVTGGSSRILYIGEVSRSKGVDVLIRAFDLVKKSISDAELIIGGKRSKDQPLLESLSREMGLKDVTFRGYIPENELPDHYSSATVMIFPSRCGFGLSTLEAMACGTPVIVGAVLDAPEFVADAGILVNPDDVDELARSIIRVLTDPELRQRLSVKAIERSKAFSWKNMADNTVEVYRTVLGEG